MLCKAFSSCGERNPLSSCDTRAELLRGMWNLPEAGVEPVSPILAGGFLTTGPQGKSPKSHYIIIVINPDLFLPS